MNDCSLLAAAIQQTLNLPAAHDKERSRVRLMMFQTPVKLSGDHLSD